jgi:hypothetical protein
MPLEGCDHGPECYFRGTGALVLSRKPHTLNVGSPHARGGVVAIFLPIAVATISWLSLARLDC